VSIRRKLFRCEHLPHGRNGQGVGRLIGRRILRNARTAPERNIAPPPPAESSSSDSSSSSAVSEYLPSRFKSIAPRAPRAGLSFSPPRASSTRPIATEIITCGIRVVRSDPIRSDPIRSDPIATGGNRARIAPIATMHSTCTRRGLTHDDGKHRSRPGHWRASQCEDHI
jgi:hypothetical protein